MRKQASPTLAIGETQTDSFSPEDPAIVAIVVTFHSAATIDACLQRLRSAHGVQEIRVVDNGSSDATLSIVQKHALADARLRFIANPDNPGFSVACNQAVAQSRSPWLAFVNPDCYIDPLVLLRLRQHAQELGGMALIGADLRDEDGKSDPAAARRDPVFSRMLRSLAQAQLGVERAPHMPLQLVDAVSGALFLLPRGLFQQVGGFDPGYRLHVEDLDLCRRVRRAGGLVAVANDTSAVHVRGVSSRQNPWFVEWHKHRGLWRYFVKFEAPDCSFTEKMAVFFALGARFTWKIMHWRRQKA